MKTIFFICLISLAVMAAADDFRLERLLHRGNNKFTANMFSEVAKANPEKSFVLSAFSVLTPLAQLGLASVGESHDELLDAIGMPNDNTTKEVFSLVNTKVKSIKGVTLKTASKIYVADGFELNADFASVTRDTFGSELQNINFLNKEAAAKEVNDWIEEQTNNRIKDLVKPDILTEDTRALLVNAIYFKGLWKDPFHKRLTRETDFHVNKNKDVKVSMMYRKGDYRYTESPELKSQIIEIPYEGDESALVVVLPRDIEGIKEVEELLKDPQILDNALRNLHETEVDLYLPKFKTETTTDLKEILQKINVQRMFTPGEARLENLIKDVKDLYIDSATQKAFIEVNEEGAEAAAANAFSAVVDSLIIGEKPPTIFYANRPFYYIVKTFEIVIESEGSPPAIFYADRPFYYAINVNHSTLFSGVMYAD